jgi:hypothetical protein
LIDIFDVSLQFFEGHCGGLNGASVTLADATEVFSRQFANFVGRFFALETHG